MARREFLQLAKVYDSSKHDITGYYVSEKLDGTRCVWIPESRGVPTIQVPWANVTDPKTGKRKAKIKPVSTGLWSRYGNPIIMDDAFLNTLPCLPLDGELWAGRGNFQLCRSICGGDNPDPRFEQIEFAVYGSPPLESLFGDGEIKNTNYHSTFNFKQIKKWLDARRLDDYQSLPIGSNFDRELCFLAQALETQNDTVYLHRHVRLPDDPAKVPAALDKFLTDVLEKGGEGVVIRNPAARWTPKRVKDLLKMKPFLDAEGVLVGFTSGRKTNKGSKHLGKIGALILDFNGLRLELSGLTDIEREFESPAMVEHAKEHPGKDMPKEFQGKHFKVGNLITFRYRELSVDGIPKEGRYLRKREVE